MYSVTSCRWTWWGLCLRPLRSDLRHLALLCGGGVELERVADPGPLGLSLPDRGEHPPVAAGRLQLRPHLHHRHPRVPAQTPVRPRRRHRGRCPQQKSRKKISFYSSWAQTTSLTWNIFISVWEKGHERKLHDHRKIQGETETKRSRDTRGCDDFLYKAPFKIKLQRSENKMNSFNDYWISSFKAFHWLNMLTWSLSIKELPLCFRWTSSVCFPWRYFIISPAWTLCWGSLVCWRSDVSEFFISHITLFYISTN